MVVIRGGKHLLRLPAAPPFAFAVCGSDFKGSSRLELIFRALSSPSPRALSSSFFRALSIHGTSKSRLAQGEKRRGTEEVQRARTGRTDRSLGDRLPVGFINSYRGMLHTQNGGAHVRVGEL